jgi:hypothetical protein
MKSKIRIGCGAGFSGDRLEPAIVLCEQGEIDYLVLECLAERTIALAQKRKLHDPTKGYDPLLERRLTGLLPLLLKNNICLITNMGAANPIAGAEKIVQIANQLDLSIKITAVLGDDVLPMITEKLADHQYEILDNDISERCLHHPISANAYMGVEGILEALSTKPNVIITGRVADPALFLAPMIHEFHWALDDYDRLGKGSIIGHLMECAGQLTGGYFADPKKKPVGNLATLGHPYVDVFPDGDGIIGKVKGTGGMINLQTVKEQLLYEITNPHQYITPDVIADITSIKIKEIDTDQIHVTGGTGTEKPASYKVSVGYKAGYLGEGEISYAGAAALERAQLAGQIIEQRIKHFYKEFRVDYIGINSVHRQNIKNIELSNQAVPYEIRLRIAAKCDDQDLANLVGEEVEALYTNGPSGGGGVRKYANEVIGIFSILMPRNNVKPNVHIIESKRN